ncbi:ABC transporter ATP-binding protein [[Clostridium] colinum]|uniref:ABC transporter ATP-binding protein n=1 Tax=[Clostridium] colinum TaxID=36835 RepID=UPI002023C7A1|nr:ABC transporter ATP-binding protein [[Clostridium] colinum]
MIKLENVSAYYGKKQVLKNINFEIKKNENFIIIGLNGCGKTTLLKTICNTIEFTGNVYIKNKNVKHYKRKELAKQLCMLGQINNIYFNYTVFDTVMMGRYIYSDAFSIKESLKDIEIVENALKIVNLYNIKDQKIDTLSGGQLQRVFLAKIITQNPQIILLDEPTNHLDLPYQIELINFLKKWGKEENKTIIGVLHDINLALNLTDNILALDNGEIKYFGKSKEFLNSNKINEIYKMDIKNYMIQNLKKWENL